MALISINPATLEIISETAELSDAELEQKLADAHAAYTLWRTVPIDERAVVLKKTASHLREKREEYALLISQEVGKTIAAALGEVDKSALVCDYYADNAKAFLSPEHIAADAKDSYVRFDPLGTVLAVMPWNFPFWQVFRFAAPALMAGNVGILKHASNVQGSAFAIEKAFLAGGAPHGVFQNLAISSGRVAKVVADPRVLAATLTGSEKAGSSVAEIAGRELKKTVLELGGSDPFVVFSDADIEKAARVAVAARLQANVGQSCIAAKRFIVHKDVIEKFTELAVQEINSLVVGDPTDPKTNVGPLVNEQMVTDIESQVARSVEMGAKIAAGGVRLERTGYFYPPTVLTAVTEAMPVFAEEVFGPVMPIIAFTDESDAIRLANKSQYGLGATVFTKDLARGERVAAQIESGAVFINSQVKSDPRLPFGGIKKSGYGRELSHYGIREFVNIKTVSISE